MTRRDRSASQDAIPETAAPDALSAVTSDTLVDRLRQRTKLLHRDAERSGIIARILHGTSSSLGYALYLRNLVPAYDALEAALADSHQHPVSRLWFPALMRVEPLKRDLETLCGADWSTRLPVLPAALTYAVCISTSASDKRELIMAHAYVRYLGDLSGGQVMRRLLTKSLSLQPDALHFHDFPGIDDIAGFKARYLATIDEIGAAMSNWDAVLDEAAEAFRLNIEVSTAVLDHFERL